MRQHTTPEQTAKLIELGFEKPKNTQYIQRAGEKPVREECKEPVYYTIDYTIEQLAEYIASIKTRSSRKYE